MTNKIQFIDFFKDGEDYINGEEMLKRCDKDMAGKEDLEYYQAHPKLLEDYKDKYLIFGNYTKLDSDRNRYVAYLYWDGGLWDLRWLWLGNAFHRDDLVVGARKSLDSGTLGTSDSLPLELEINGVKYRKV